MQDNLVVYRNRVEKARIALALKNGNGWKLLKSIVGEEEKEVLDNIKSFKVDEKKQLKWAGMCSLLDEIDNIINSGKNARDYIDKN